MIKLKFQTAAIIILSLLAASCSTTNKSGSDDYFGYSNETDPPERTKTTVTQGQNVQSQGSGYYVTENNEAMTAQRQSSYDPPLRVYNYYNYYDPYYDRPFVPYRLSHMDSYMYYNKPGFSVYITNRPHWWYDHYEPWRHYRTHHYYHYPYNNTYYGYYGYNHWGYFHRYYNSYSYQPKYISNDRRDSRETMRGFGPSRGTYNGGSRGSLRSTRTTSSGSRSPARATESAREGWEGLYEDNYRGRGSGESNTRSGRQRIEGTQSQTRQDYDPQTRGGNLRSTTKENERQSSGVKRSRTNREEIYRSPSRKTYDPPNRSRYKGSSESRRSSGSNSREYRRSSGSRGG